MITKIYKLSKSFGLVLIFITGCYNCSAQDAYMDLADTSSKGLFQNFLGIKFFAADFGATSLNQDLQFKYTSIDAVGLQYVFRHDMNVKGINNFFNIGLGTEENVGKHLSINFFNTSIGYIQHTFNWNVNLGAGYFISLNKEQTMRLNASLNVCFESITYSFGNYYDSTGIGFIIDGVSIGTAVKNVKYVNIVWSLSPGIEFLYRRSSVDFFAGIYYNYVFSYHEKINFYINSIPVSEGIVDQNGNYVSRDVINMNKYIIQLGIIREFGL